LSSDFIHEHELGPVLKEATRGGVKILWFPIRDSAYKKTPLKDYQAAVLDPSKPLASMTKARRDQAWVKICEEIEKAVKRPKESLPEEARSAAAREVALSNLPERNPFFTGRDAVLTQLREALTARGRAALSGLGGVGKTQAAVEYAHRHFAEYVHAFLVTADLRETLVSGFVTIARRLKLPEADSQDQTLAVEAVECWLGSHEGWLLILDNADDLAMVNEFIPRGKNGHVILTTRARAVGAVARLVEIQEMQTEEGALFLLRRATCIAEDAPLEAAGEDDRAQAKEIAAQLDGLPLALDQAAAYIEETACGLSGYLSFCRAQVPELLRLRGALTSDHPDPVATTWALSFDKVEQANSAAAELLRFCAFLHPDGIPEEIFSKGAAELGPMLGSVASNALAWNNAWTEVLKYSLLRRDPNARTLEIHRLVQTVLKQGMDEATHRLWAERAVRAVKCAFPDVEFSTWAVCDRLLPQAYACAELINRWSFESSAAAGLLNDAGVYLYERGRYTDAEPLYQQALAIREKTLGPEHPDLAQSLNNLAGLYATQGRYIKAEPLYQRALAIREKALGPEDRDVAWSLNDLGVLYYSQDQYGKAEPLLQRALAIWETALGPDHRDVATCLSNLAGLYAIQGQYTKAEPLYQRALAIREKALAPEDPDVAWSLNGLAGLHRVQGQYAKAEALYKGALAIWEKVLGPEHPDVAWSLNNLAGIFAIQGQYTKAAPLYERALAIREKSLGPEHRAVATCLSNLAMLLRATNRLAEAEPLYIRALAIYEKSFGPEHPNVAKCLENYAPLLRAMGRPEGAEPLVARAKAIRANQKTTV
jgi:tetratricopeptide (TPR) repeat protein